MDIPPQILAKLRKCESEAHETLKEAGKNISDFETNKIHLTVSSSSPLAIMSWKEQAQSLAFVVRYEHLPEINSFVAGRHPTTGRYYLNEIDQIRAALNEYRTIFYNRGDGIFYGAITNLYQKAFNPAQPDKAPMQIMAQTASGQDVSSEYLKHLKSRKQAINDAVQHSDFDFIYNGVLQHADARYAMQMVKQYTDGSLAYLLLKNVIIAQGLKGFLSEHYKVINIFNFPRMGPL